MSIPRDDEIGDECKGHRTAPTTLRLVDHVARLLAAPLFIP
jgi:hypothetical protein